MLERPLTAIAIASGSIGAFGWLDRAGLLAARNLGWAALDPLWPFYLAAAIASLSAQPLAITGATFMVRLRFHVVALALYASGAAFAAYSTHLGADLIVNAGAQAAFEQREADRASLLREIETSQAIIADERAKLPMPGSVGPRTLAAATARFEVATAEARRRLPEAQAALAAAPRLQRRSDGNIALYLVLFVWALFEPWFFTLRDMELRQRPPPARATGGASHTRGEQGAKQRTKWFRALTTPAVALGALAAGAHASGTQGPLEGQAPRPAQELPSRSPPTLTPDPLRTIPLSHRAPPRDGPVRATGAANPRRRKSHFPAPTVAGAIERYRAGESADRIADALSCDRSTVYRWLKRSGVATSHRRSPRDNFGTSHVGDRT